jgi:dihydroorotate dehydrogenase subfamily 2
MLSQTIDGLNFVSPLGLGAGFDKHGRMLLTMKAIGFSFQEVGSITAEPGQGHARPRLFRLPKTRSLGVWYGLKNDGIVSVCDRLRSYEQDQLNSDHNNYHYGINIAATNNEQTCSVNGAIQDLMASMRESVHLGAYTCINISCPNTEHGTVFNEDMKALDLLLLRMSKELSSMQMETRRVFLKLSSQMTNSDLHLLLQTILQYDGLITGIICGNLLKNPNRERDNIHRDDTIPAQGGLSGMVVQGRSTSSIGYLYQHTRTWSKKPILIGVGGIFTAHDAYLKIKAGASLLQCVSTVIFDGPQTVAMIQQGLVRLLRQDGYHNISQAIGADYHSPHAAPKQGLTSIQVTN